MNKINTKFNLEDKVKIIETANFREKTEKNRLIYNTYKNRVGTVKEIRPTNSKSITYIIEMTAKSGNTFSFDILEKYIQEYNDVEYLINEKVKVKDDANFIEKSEENKKLYETYKNKDGVVVDKKNSTYIVEFSDNKIDILGKYLEKIN
jgi:ribosomal protein L21E